MAPQFDRAAWSIMVRDARRAALLTIRTSSRGDGRESVLDDRPHYAAVQVVSARLDCFAALAMTVSGFPRRQDSAASQLRIKPMAQRFRQRRPRLLKLAELLDPSAIHPAQLLLDRGQIDASGFALAYDGAAIDHDVAHHRGVAAREQEFHWVDRHDPVAVEAIEIEHDEVGWSPRRQLARAGRAGARAAVAEGEAKNPGRGPGALEAEAAMGKLHQPH